MDEPKNKRKREGEDGERKEGRKQRKKNIIF